MLSREPQLICCLVNLSGKERKKRRKYMFLLLPFGILFLVILFLIMKIDKKITKKNEIICVIVFLLLCPYFCAYLVVKLLVFS